MRGDSDNIFAPVTVTTTAEEVYRRVKQAITDGDLAPGTRLVESALAKRLGVSRTPVREALQRLVQDGLAAVDGGRGLIVARLSIENIRHAYVLREALEGLAARLAAAHQRPDLLEILSGSLRAMEHGTRDVAAFDQAHSTFHDTIAEMSGNPFIIQALKGLDGFRTRMVSLDWVTQKRVFASVPEHRLIFEAIELRQPDLAEQHARTHVRQTRDGLIRRLGGVIDP